jgi:hypothetical protein
MSNLNKIKTILQEKISLEDNQPQSNVQSVSNQVAKAMTSALTRIIEAEMPYEAITWELEKNGDNQSYLMRYEDVEDTAKQATEMVLQSLRGSIQSLAEKVTKQLVG